MSQPYSQSPTCSCSFGDSWGLPGAEGTSGRCRRTPADVILARDPLVDIEPLCLSNRAGIPREDVLVDVLGPLDELLRAGCVHFWLLLGLAGQLPASAVVLRTLTSRNNAVGQPWETEATWPGCALPQLKAPPSCQVCGPPTASIDPQKSVVVAW